MTIQTVSPFYLPAFGTLSGNWGTSASAGITFGAALDAANEAAAVCFTCPASGSLTHIAIRTQTVSVTSGPLNFDCRLETLSNGRPSGSLQAANTNAAWSLATTDDNIWKENALTAAATVTAGDELAVVVKAPGSGTFSFTWAAATLAFPLPSPFPTFVTDVNATPDGVYETNTTSVMPLLALKIDGVYHRIMPWIPLDTITANAYTNASSPDEYALRLQFPVSMRVSGAAIAIADVAAAGSFAITLWPDSASSQTDADALAQKVMDSDALGSATLDGVVHVTFAASVTLTANTPYWLGVRADSATSITKLGFTMASAIGMVPTPGGSEFYSGTRAWSGGSAPAFTNALLTQQMSAVRIDGIDFGSGGLAAIGNAG